MQEKPYYSAQKGLIYSIQRYCIHDGPGIRTIVFFKGCEMKCPWCANPESQFYDQEIGRNKSKCIYCGSCVKACSENALSMNKDIIIDKNLCNLCGKCVRACPKDAWMIYGESKSVDELVAEIEKDSPYYKKSGGGVTFSGGEPTMQSGFLFELLKSCKQKGINTAIESHGYTHPDVIRQIADYTDLFMIDVKHMDTEVHRKVIGCLNELVHKNIRMLAFDLHKKVSLRMPLIPGFNDNLENIRKTIDFATEIRTSGNLKMVHILPYHKMGSGKYEILGREYSIKEIDPPSQKKINEIIEAFGENEIPVQNGG